MARAHQRVFTLILAILFLGTSVATGVAVIWQINQDNNGGGDERLTSEQQEQLDDLIEEQSKEGKLEGTTLKDFEPVANVSDLKIIDLKIGDGEEVKEGASVTAHYTGALAKDGKIFQSSHDMGEPIEFSLDGVIAGWTEGVPGMKVGGKRRLVIPYEKAYGEAGQPSGGIPAKADLVFDIELTAVKNP